MASDRFLSHRQYILRRRYSMLNTEIRRPRYDLLYEAYILGQVPEKDWQEILDNDQVFRAYVKKQPRPQQEVRS